MSNSTLEQLKTLPLPDLLLEMDFAQPDHLQIAHDCLDNFFTEIAGPLSHEKTLQPNHLAPLIKLLHNRISTQTPDHKQLKVIVGDTPMLDGSYKWMVADKRISLSMDTISIIEESQSEDKACGFTIQFLANPNRQSPDSRLIKDSGLNKTQEQNLDILLGLLKTPNVVGVPPEYIPSISSLKVIPFKLQTTFSNPPTSSQRLNLF